MEIVTAPYQPAPSLRSRLLVGFAVFAPVTVLALLPIGLGLERYVVRTDDMAPGIPRGSVVLERAVPVGDLRVGDVVTYVPPASSGVEGNVTHRIVSAHGRHLLTQGDANPQIDPWPVPTSGTTVSRVVWSLPKVGFLYLALVRPGAWGGVALVLLAALSFGLAWSSGRHRSRRDPP